MKKRIITMLALLLALVFALVGCGSSSNASGSSSDKPSATSEAKEEAEESASEESAEPAENTVKYFVESEVGDEVKAEIAEAISDIEIYSGFDMYAEGDNLLVYEYQYIEDLDAEATAANLASMHDELAESLKDTTEGLIEAGLENAECMFRYVTYDGELIYEQKYPE